ncbi:MAG: heme ABC exporter ATP-binding protein CcmA, partial [Komagataeibacter saccharivorans]
LWLLDEPSLGLDTSTMGLLGTLFAAHRQAGGIVIATTHVPLPLPNPRTLALPGLNESDIPQPMEDFPEDDLL